MAQKPAPNYDEERVKCAIILIERGRALILEGADQLKSMRVDVNNPFHGSEKLGRSDVSETRSSFHLSEDIDARCIGLQQIIHRDKVETFSCLPARRQPGRRPQSGPRLFTQSSGSSSSGGSASFCP